MLRQNCSACAPIKDFGGQPLVENIDRLARQNTNYRTAIWTGNHLQATLMSIPTGADIGIEMHSDTDQFLKIVDGAGLFMAGKSKDDLSYQTRVNGNSAVFVPSGTWHNIKNIGNRPLKLYSLYAPPHHPFGAVQKTKADGEY